MVNTTQYKVQLVSATDEATVVWQIAIPRAAEQQFQCALLSANSRQIIPSVALRVKCDSVD